jgi:O-antigen/teichoic acid export membrane protein
VIQIISNSLRLILTRGINALALLGLVVIISRRLGPEIFGDFSFLNAIVLTGIVMAGYGLDSYLVREISRDKARGNRLLSTVLEFKALSSLLIFMCIIILFGYVLDAKGLMGFLSAFSVIVFFNTFSQSFWFYSDAFDNFRLHSTLWATSNILKVLMVLVILSFRESLSAVIYAIIFSEGVTLVLSYRSAATKYGIKFSFIPFDEIFHLLKRCFPLAIIFSLSAIYFRIDIIMLELLNGKHAVGQYAAAFKLVELLSIIPHTVCLAAFPSLSNNFIYNIDEYVRDSYKIMLFLGVSGLMLSLLVYFFSDAIIELIYGPAYRESANSFKIFSMVVVLLFINGYFAFLNLAGNQETLVALVLVAATFLNIILNFQFIPRYSHVGAVYATLFSEILILALYLVHHARFYVHKKNCQHDLQ